MSALLAFSMVVSNGISVNLSKIGFTAVAEDSADDSIDIAPKSPLDDKPIDNGGEQAEENDTETPDDSGQTDGDGEPAIEDKEINNAKDDSEQPDVEEEATDEDIATLAEDDEQEEDVNAPVVDVSPWITITDGVYRAYNKSAYNKSSNSKAAAVDLSNPNAPKVDLTDNKYTNPLVIYNGTTLTVEGYTPYYEFENDEYITDAKFYGINVKGQYDVSEPEDSGKESRFIQVGDTIKEEVDITDATGNTQKMLKITSQFKANDIEADDIGVYCVTFNTGNLKDANECKQLFLYQRPTLISIKSQYDLKDMNRINERLAGATDIGDVPGIDADGNVIIGKYNSNCELDGRGYQVHIGDPLEIQGAAINGNYGTFELVDNDYIKIASQANGLVKFSFEEDRYDKAWGTSVKLTYKTGVKDEYDNYVVEDCYLTITSGGYDRKYDHADIEIADGGKYTVESEEKNGDKLVKKEKLIYDAYIEDVNYSEIYNSKSQLIERYENGQYWKNPKYKIGDAQYELTSKWLVNDERKAGISFKAGDDYVFFMRRRDYLILNPGATLSVKEASQVGGYQIIDGRGKVQNVQSITANEGIYVIANVNDDGALDPVWGDSWKDKKDNYGTRKVYKDGGKIIITGADSKNTLWVTKDATGKVTDIIVPKKVKDKDGNDVKDADGNVVYEIPRPNNSKDIEENKPIIIKSETEIYYPDRVDCANHIFYVGKTEYSYTDNELYFGKDDIAVSQITSNGNTYEDYNEIIGDGIVVQDHVDHALFDVQLVLKPNKEVVTYYDTEAIGEVISRVETTLYDAKGYPDKKTIEYYENGAPTKKEEVDLPNPEDADMKKITIPSVQIEMDAQDVIDAHNKCPDHSGLDFTVTSDIQKLITLQYTSAAPKATKKYNGSTSLGDKSYEFELVDSDNTVVSRVKNDEDGNIEFDSLEFFNTGTYEYTMREVANEDDKTTRYDDTTYTVKVNVTEIKEEEKVTGLMASVSYYKDNLIDNTDVVFNNYPMPQFYKLPSAGGPGVYIYIISGVGLMLSAAVMYCRKRKEE